MRLLVVIAACALLSIASPASPAAASCTEDAGPDGSQVIFVGTMQEERRGYARFTVDEVRAGPDLAPEVWVLAGQEQPPWPLSLLSGVASSIDADFVEGKQYVVGASASYSTNVCTVSEGAGDQDPDARAPVAGGDTGADPPIGLLGQSLLVTVLALGVAAITVVLRRARRADSKA